METKIDRGPVNLYLNKELVRRLQERAEAIGTSASAIVESLVELFLDWETVDDKTSVHGNETRGSSPGDRILVLRRV